MKRCACGEPAEWCDEWCQMCWEAESSRMFWEMVGSATAYWKMLYGEHQEEDDEKSV